MDSPKADAPNRVWAVDFQFDAITDGRPIKLVSIIDEHTRECLTNLVDRAVTADTLIDELDRVALTRGYPDVLRCDNGPDLACEAMADWAGERVAAIPWPLPEGAMTHPRTAGTFERSFPQHSTVACGLSRTNLLVSKSRHGQIKALSCGCPRECSASPLNAARSFLPT